MNEGTDLTPSLLVELRRGEESAGRLLDRLYRPAMLRFCLGYLGDPADAEDAVQEIFCRILEARTVPDEVRPWLYRVARNHCLNRLRSQGRRRDAGTLPAEVELVQSATGQLTGLLRAEEGERMARALERLSAEQREVLRLRYTEGLARREIAAVLGLTPSVVKSRLFEGVKKLRSAVEGT